MLGGLKRRTYLGTFCNWLLVMLMVQVKELARLRSTPAKSVSAKGGGSSLETWNLRSKSMAYGSDG